MVTLKAVAINVTIILMLLNATPALLVNSGVAEDFGVDPAVGGDQRIDYANQNMSDVEPSGGIGDTLFQLFSSVTEPVKAVVDVLFAGPKMFNNLGVPEYITTFIFAPLYLITGGTIIYVLAGRRL